MFRSSKYFDVRIIVMFIAVLAAGCPSKETTAKSSATQEVADAKQPENAEPEDPLDPKAALEVACFEGDKDACDQLGH